ncbi:MAG: cupin domain-containing protein [Alphaproteobacteria bacterium]|jgi:anti-sigma factor ChrR (cupin superfamily)|nr:cupin domain-containing protein [Alphaproteobacteria bacterium]MDP6874312.1 cupin domain-containing protein [Alphaproteobacteria bacterium]
MTTAITPNAPNHEGLGPLDSRFVETHSMPWEETRYPGVEAKTLLVDRRTGLLTALLKMAPGAVLPDHEHVQIEQTFVIEGALVCGEGTCSAGNFVWRPAGSRHQAGTPNGALMLAMFQLPNKFFDADGGVTDMLNQDWDEIWGQATGNKL